MTAITAFLEPGENPGDCEFSSTVEVDDADAGMCVVLLAADGVGSLVIVEDDEDAVRI